MVRTRMLGRREFLGATLGSVGGAALIDEDGNYRHPVNCDTLTWPRDAAVMLPTGLLICNFVSEGRAFSAHPMRFAAEYAPSLTRYPVMFDAIEEQVLVEGGDVQVHDAKTLVVGFGNRTKPGAPRRLAQRLNMDVVAVRAPA